MIPRGKSWAHTGIHTGEERGQREGDISILGEIHRGWLHFFHKPHRLHLWKRPATRSVGSDHLEDEAGFCAWAHRYMHGRTIIMQRQKIIVDDTDA